MSEEIAEQNNRQAAAQKRKRQERDAFLKQQAAERKSVQQAEVNPDGDATPEEKQEPAPLFPEKRKRVIPKLLPLELLESDDEDDTAQQAESAAKSKKRKIVAAGETWVGEAQTKKNLKVGSALYQVAGSQRDGNLAPKAKKNSVNLREQLLKRHRAPEARKGFFVKSR